jgi:hypothetical protein
MTEPTSYDDLAAQLLADIADRLLSKRDWATLERLQKALEAPALREVPSYITRTTDSTEYAIPDALKTIYSKKMAEVDRSMLESLYKMIPTPDPEPPLTTNKFTQFKKSPAPPETKTLNGASYNYLWMDETSPIWTRGTES